METIKITCEAKDFLSLEEIQEFQGTLKKHEQYDVDHIAESILKHGFFAPFFVWRRPDDTCSCLDGHGRQLALTILESEGYTIPPLPVIYIDAESEAEAREKLIYINTISGQFSETGFKDLVKDLDNIDLSSYTYPTLDMDKIIDEMYKLAKAQAVLESTMEVNPIENVSEIAIPPLSTPNAEPKTRVPSSPQKLPAAPMLSDDVPEPDQELIVHCPKCKKSFIHNPL
jgi:hypothetical protein